MIAGHRNSRERDADTDDDIERGRRLLAEGRLTVLGMDGLRVRALCVGHRGDYDLGYDADRGWWCSCGSFGYCAHLMALRLVTERGLIPVTGRPDAPTAPSR